MFLSSWIGSVFGKRREIAATRGDNITVLSVYVGEIVGNSAVSAEFWKDGRFRLIDNRGKTILAGSLLPRSGGMAWVEHDPAIFADVDRAAQADQIGPVVRRERAEY